MKMSLRVGSRLNGSPFGKPFVAVASFLSNSGIFRGFSKPKLELVARYRFGESNDNVAQLSELTASLGLGPQMPERQGASRRCTAKTGG